MYILQNQINKKANSVKHRDCIYKVIYVLNLRIFGDTRYIKKSSLKSFTILNYIRAKLCAALSSDQFGKFLILMKSHVSL